MTLLEWIGTGALDFAMSLLAFVIALHFDFEGWWQQRHIRKGKKMDEQFRWTRPNDWG